MYDGFCFFVFVKFRFKVLWCIIWDFISSESVFVQNMNLWDNWWWIFNIVSMILPCHFLIIFLLFSWCILIFSKFVKNIHQKEYISSLKWNRPHGLIFVNDISQWWRRVLCYEFPVEMTLCWYHCVRVHLLIVIFDNVEHYKLWGGVCTRVTFRFYFAVYCDYVRCVFLAPSIDFSGYCSTRIFTKFSKRIEWILVKRVRELRTMNVVDELYGGESLLNSVTECGSMLFHFDCWILFYQFLTTYLFLYVFVFAWDM